MFLYLDANLAKIIRYSANPTFNKSHQTVFGSTSYLNHTKMGLFWIVFLHYRRLAYSFILTALSNYQGIQIGLIMLLSL